LRGVYFMARMFGTDGVRGKANVELLEGKGKISKDEADKKAVEEYREYNKNQPIESDFDKDIKRLFNAVKK